MFGAVGGVRVGGVVVGVAGAMFAAGCALIAACRRLLADICMLHAVCRWQLVVASSLRIRFFATGFSSVKCATAQFS